MLTKTTTTKSVFITSVISLLLTLVTYILGMAYFPVSFNNQVHGFGELMALVSLLFGPALIQLSVIIHYWKFHTHN